MTDNLTWHMSDSPQALAASLADEVADKLQFLLQQRQQVQLYVSGGQTPVLFFQALSRRKLPWQRVQIGLVDERRVPHTHPDSNTALVQRHLLTNEAADAIWCPIVSPDGQALE